MPPRRVAFAGLDTARRALGIALVLACGAAPLRATVADADAAKARIERRLATLVELKAKGLVGENNRGFATLRGHDLDAGDAVAAENRDRRMIYEIIAEQTGAGVEQIGRTVAQQIVAASAKGAWLQRDDGTWYKK